MKRKIDLPIGSSGSDAETSSHKESLVTDHAKPNTDLCDADVLQHEMDVLRQEVSAIETGFYDRLRARSQEASDGIGSSS
ncbi:MAG: hypothetical protein H7839_08940 [Magnetococcus sp. YQC-5]